MTAAERGPVRVVGRYALYHEIAAGGMATVHIGRLLGPVGFARTVAVKRLHPQFAKDPEFVSMFLDEARVAARVQHPNVVATIDVVATDGELFLIMDYIRGESLSKLLRMVRKQGERMPPRIAASICCGLLHGLHAAHEAKNERGGRIDLVHRDVSPQNVLVGADGIARVLDFGIAKAAGRIQVTRDGQIKGKLAYMPPEQLSGRELTRAVDIYAAAVVMWEALTGERLFKGETESETLAKILRDEVLPPSAIVPGLTTAFDAALLRALSRDPAQRHATARELAFELEKCVGVASATEVGEWVEQMAGPVLTAREDQIAQIESHSYDLRVLPESPDSESDSDFGLPAIRARDGGRAAGTLLGIGADVPPSSRSLGSSVTGRTAEVDDSVLSRVTGTASTATMTLPTDRRLPLLASALGVLVLLGVVAFVLLDRPARSEEQASAVRARGAERLEEAGAGDGVPAPDPALAADGGAGVTPGSAAAAGPAASSGPAPSVGPATPAGTSATSAHLAARPPPAATPAGTSAGQATRGPTGNAAPRPKERDCNPPFTIDANGRKKYKLECM
ncbi:MAG: Serine/threonine-protein kinase Pkn6 [Labilithrix sp.]|nr:Serine/threonine-protein kinase Pkn6 [Labilithrix sp.]